MTAVESMYDVFLAAAHTRRALGTEVDTLRKEWGEPPVQEYRTADELEEEEGGDIILPWVVSHRSSDLARYLEFVHANVRLVAPEDALRIRSVRMSSPGEISLEGLGEAIKQLRELIKDLSYRNADEKKLSRLEVAEKYIEFALRYGVVGPSQVPGLVQAVLDGADVVEELQMVGKLPELPPTTGSEDEGGNP